MPVYRGVVTGSLVLMACGSTEEPLVFDTDVSSAELASGQELYTMHCAECHDDDGRGTSEGPDLTVRVQDMSPAEVAAVVVRGDGRMQPVEMSNDEAFIVSVWVVETFGDAAR